MHLIPWLMTAPLLAAAPAPAPAAATPTTVHEQLRYRTTSLDGATSGGSAVLEVTRRGERVELREERQLPEGSRAVFRVVFSSRDGEVERWESEHVVQGKTTRASLRFGRAQIESRVERPDGTVLTDRMPRSSGQPVVTPLLKFELARRLQRGGVAEPLDMLVLQDGELESHRLRVEDQGERAVTTAAGRFRCRVLVLKPESSLLALAMPPGEMLLAVDGEHPLVLGEGSVSRLSQVMRTELVAYRRESRTP